MKQHIFLLFSLLLPVLALGQTESSSVKFLQLTDTHVCDLRHAAAPLAQARQHFSQGGTHLASFLADPDRPSDTEFILHTGDMTDGFSYENADGKPTFGQIDAFQRAVAGYRDPIYLLLGNHDLAHYAVSDAGKPASDQSVANEARAAWIEAAPCFHRGTYYVIEKQVGPTKYAILMLDNAYNAAGANDKGGFRMAHEQLYWIRRQTEIYADSVIIVALHVPLEDNPASEAIREAFSQANNVALILGGHFHRNQIDEVSLGGKPVTQVRTAAFGYGINNWRVFNLFPDHIDVFSTGEKDTVEKTIPVNPGHPGSEK